MRGRKLRAGRAGRPPCFRGGVFERFGRRCREVKDVKKTVVSSEAGNSVPARKGAGRPRVYADEEVFAALRAAAEKLGCAPTARDYRLFRVENPALPSDTAVRIRFGSWTAALKAAGLPRPCGLRLMKRKEALDRALAGAAACLRVRPFLTLDDLERLGIDREVLKAFLPDALVLKAKGEMAELLARVAEAGFPLPARPEHARGRDFAFMVAEGMEFKAIGKRVGLTRERVRQVVAAYARHVLSGGTLPRWGRGPEVHRERAAAALRAAADELGQVPTKEEYGKLRALHPHWPPAHAVAGAFGGWRRALYLALTGGEGAQAEAR